MFQIEKVVSLKERLRLSGKLRQEKCLHFLQHPAGTSINFAFCEGIRKFCPAFTMVVYEKIFGSINR